MPTLGSAQGDVPGGALEWALGALARRDVSGADLERKLAAKGFSEDERCDALATLRRTGLVDDERYANARASSLAGRRAGDDLIRHDLERAGLAPDVVAAAIESLEPEPVRVRRIVEGRGAAIGTQRYLAGKGFSGDAIDAVLGESRASSDGDCC